MKSTSIIGIVLLVVGIAALAYQRFSYTSRDTVVDLGPIKAEADREHTVGIPPIVGGIIAVAGVALLIAGARKNA